MPRTQLRSWYDEATDREFYISPDREAEFRRTWPKARPFVLHRGADGSETRVGLSRVESFRAEHPDAQPVYAFLGDDGETVRHVAQQDVGRYVDETNGEDRGTNAAAEGLRAAGRALASPLAGAWNAAVESVASVQEAGARRERAKAERAAPQRLPTLAQLGREIGLPADRLASLSDPDREITARDLEAQEVPQGVRDKYRTLFRHAAPADAPQTAEEARHLAEAQRRSAAAQRTREATIEPENAVERAGQTIGGGAETVAEFAAAGALGGPVAANAWMAAKGAAAAGERLEAQGASAQDAQRLAIPAGLAEAAVWAAPVAHGLAPTSRLAGAAKEAAIAGAKTDLSGVAQRAVTGEETPELRERVLEDLGGAAFGGAMGALSRPERLPRIRERAGLVRDDVHEYVHEYPLSPELIAERRAETRRAAGRESAAEMLPRLREGNAARTTIQQGIEAQTQRHLDDLAGLNGVEAQRRARQVDEILAGNAEPEGQGRVPAALRGEPGVRASFEPEVSTGPYRNAEPSVEGPTGAMQRPAPYRDALPPRLPETAEGVVAARRAALAALPAGERMKRTSKEAYRSEHEGQTPVLDALGWDAFKTISDRHKGDFRNVVGDKEVNATELAGILGRDPRDATAQSLLEEAAAEYEGYRRWKEELGAPTAELEAATGREAEWNRAQNDRAAEEAKRRWEDTHPDEAGEPPLAERDLAAREQAQELDFIERMESGAPASPQQQLPGAPKLSPLIPDAVSKAAEAVEQIRGKSDARRTAKQREVAAIGEEASSRLDGFFEPGENSEAVPVAKLFTNKLDEPRSSIDTARERMEKSARGEGAKRAPIDVVQNEDGTYTVVDGNATANALREMGEENARVRVVGRDKGTILRNSGLALEEVGVKDGNGKRITLKTEGIDVDPKSEEFREAAYKQAEENEPQLSAIVKKAGIDLGLPLDEKSKKVVMRGKNKAGPGVDEREVDKPVKKRKRVNEKTENDYDGEYNRVVDLIGGSLVLPDGMRYGDAVKAIERNLPEGAKIAKVKKCNISDQLVGYHDVKVSVRFKNGGIGEIIIVEDYLNDIKFNKGGHLIYDNFRTIDGLLDRAKRGKTTITPELEQQLRRARQDLMILSNATYARGAAAREAAASFDSMKSNASSSVTGLSSMQGLEALISSEDIARLKSFADESHNIMPPSPAEYAMPKRSLIQNDISAPPSSRGAGIAPTSENLPQRAPEVNLPRAGAQAAPAQAAPGLAAPAAPEGGSRRPGVGGGVVTPPPPGSVQARLEGMLAVDGADAPLTPERSGEYRALADEAGRSGNYATRARALQRLGEFEGLPADHPEAARSLAEHEAGKPLLQLMQLPDLVEIARTLGHGSDPKVKRVLSPGWAAGLFRPEGGRGGVPIIEVLGKLHQVVPQTERQRLASEAHLEAVRRLGPDAKAKAVKALEAEIYGRKFEDAWNDALARGPSQAMNVLAHEIGHWIDYLPDHIQKRGNILGHLAALDKWAKGWIAAEPGQKGKHADVIAAGDAAEAKILRQPAEPLERFMDRRAKARSAAEEKAALARGFLMKRDVERELSDLVAWYRCSDGLPDYFKDPGELFAEAFSAYCNAPATTRAKAPKFAAALDGWLAERPEAQRAVFEGRARAEKLAAQALRTGKAAPDLDFFGRLREKIVAGTLAREKAQLARKEAQRQPMRDVCDLALATFVGRMEPIFRRARAAGGWKEDLADRVMGSILRFEHAGTAHEAEILRVRSELLPIVEGLEGGQGALDEFLMLRRIASETLGKERERGRVNLANPSGVTPGSAREVEWGRSAQARLQWIRENQPEQWEKLNRAADTLVDIRRGRGRSVLAELRDSGLIREDAMKEIWNNTDYAAFRRQLGMGDALPPVNGKRAAGDMSTWSGVYKQVTGSYGDIESPLLATLVGDATILRLARLNAARRDTAALLRRFFPGEVREVDESRWHANSHGEKIPEQSKDARWRTLVWKENGETRALEVPRLVADALADERKDWGAAQAAVNFFNAAGRAWSMAMTGMNYAFATKNVFRDKAAIARAMPGRDWDQGAGAWLSNIFGDYATAAKTFASGHGQARRLGRANAELLQGLEEGVVAPGTMGGYMASLRGDDLAALYGPDTPARQRAIRGILEKSGLAPCIEKERTVVGKLAGKLWKLYASGIEKLADQETNNKVQAMLEIRRLHPEWSENRVAFHVARYIGTPDPTDAPNITKMPVFNLLFPFWTMTAHGNYDQLGRLYRDQKVASLARYGTHFAAKALMNFSGKAVAAWGAAQLVRAAAADDGTDEGRAEAADLRAQAAMAEDFASMQEAIPVHDRFTGVCIPLAWADKDAHKVWYLRIPSDQTIVPVDAATMGGFAINAKQADWHDILDGSLSTTVPSLGPFPTAVYGLATGKDLGRGGRSIDPEDGGNVMAARLEYFLKTAGVNAAGLWTKAPWAAAEVGEDVDALERFLRIPGFNATFGSFLRCSNGGRKAMAREYNKEVKAERLRNAGDADAYLAGDEAALVRLRDRGADVGELIERAQKRRIKLETIRDPLERAGVQSGRARWNREKADW